MTPYLTIASADGTGSRRVDFAAIAALFSEDDPPPVRPRRIAWIEIGFRWMLARLRAEIAEARAIRRLERSQGPARAFSV